ncbi:hypothetical protein F5880DRAFT_1440754, partial [Lentinula raphanica]
STQKQFRITIPGHLVHPIAADLEESSRCSSLPTTWQFSNADLANSREYAWSELSPDTPDEFPSNLEALPTFPMIIAHIPYRNAAGKSAFVIENIPLQALASKKDASSEIKCFICGISMKLSDMRTHVGSHILLMLRSSSENDQGLEVMGSNPCGWCGRDSSVGGCWTRLVLDPKGKKQPRTESNCDYHYGGMRYSAAAAFSTSSPCTNMPLHCQICAKILRGEQRTFWKYNAMYHMLSEHSSEEVAGQEILLPEVPLEFILSTFTSRKEETALGV